MIMIMIMIIIIIIIFIQDNPALLLKGKTSQRKLSHGQAEIEVCIYT